MLPLIRPILAVEMDFFCSSNTIEHDKAFDNRTMLLIVKDVTLFTKSIYL